MNQPFRPLLLCLLLAALPAAAAPEDTALDNVHKAINAAENDLRQKKDAQKKAQAALGKAEAELAGVRRELNELNRRQQISWNRLQALQKSLTALQTEVSAARAQVARLLAGNYKNRQPHAVVLFLKNADNSQKSRFLRYTRYINTANDQVLQKLVAQQHQLAEREEAINTELDRLKQLGDSKKSKMKQLGAAKSQAQQESRRLDKEIAAQNQKIARLRADERRLNQVIADITQHDIARRQAENEARRAETARRAREQRQSEQQRPRLPGSGLTAEDLALEAPDGAAVRYSPPLPERQPEKVSAAPSAESAGSGLTQGSLPRPVSGSIAGRFGSPRASGGVWNGLFFATAPAPVRSVGDGRISFAAPLSGYGNTVIIDHGSGYMSIYSRLSAISAANGSRVAKGQAVGTSGTLPAGEEGLYFELRYRQKKVNPQSWLR